MSDHEHMEWDNLHNLLLLTGELPTMQNDRAQKVLGARKVLVCKKQQSPNSSFSNVTYVTFVTFKGEIALTQFWINNYLLQYKEQI